MVATSGGEPCGCVTVLRRLGINDGTPSRQEEFLRYETHGITAAAASGPQACRQIQANARQDRLSLVEARHGEE